VLSRRGIATPMVSSSQVLLVNSRFRSRWKIRSFVGGLTEQRQQTQAIEMAGKERGSLPSNRSQRRRQPLPTEPLGKRLRVFRLGKQKTTKSLSSRRSEYVSGVADRTPAAQNISSRSTGSRTFSAGSAT
jgi:hypothetical protein